MLHHILRAAAGAAWTPDNLFASGEVGLWYEVSPEYLFQDSAGTTPVTADGDPVGYVQDLSGNGNHAVQATSSKRPVYKTDGTLKWIDFNGSSHSISSASLNLNAEQFALVSIGLKQDSTNSNSMLLEYGTAFDTAGSFYNYSPIDKYESSMYGTSQLRRTVTGYAAPITNIYSSVYDFSLTGSDGCKVRIDGAYITGSTNGGDASGSSFANNTLYIGGRTGSSLYLDGRIYGLIITTNSQSSNMEKAEKYLAELSGVTI